MAIVFQHQDKFWSFYKKENSKNCEDCREHAAKRRRFIKSHGGLEAIKLKWENRLLKKKWTKVKLAHSKAHSELEAVQKAVAKIKQFRGEYEEKTLFIHESLTCHTDECLEKCLSDCTCT